MNNSWKKTAMHEKESINYLFLNDGGNMTNSQQQNQQIRSREFRENLLPNVDDSDPPFFSTFKRIIIISWCQIFFRDLLRENLSTWNQCQDTTLGCKYIFGISFLDWGLIFNTNSIPTFTLVTHSNILSKKLRND